VAIEYLRSDPRFLDDGGHAGLLVSLGHELLGRDPEYQAADAFVFLLGQIYVIPLRPVHIISECRLDLGKRVACLLQRGDPVQQFNMVLGIERAVHGGLLRLLREAPVRFMRADIVRTSAMAASSRVGGALPIRRVHAVWNGTQHGPICKAMNNIER
jgi:hypothetical protein